jgi:hypothetical protein
VSDINYHASHSPYGRTVGTAPAPAGVGRSIGTAVWGGAIVALVFFGLGMIVDAAKAAIEALTGIFAGAVCVAVLVFIVYLMFRGLPLPVETETQNVVPEQSPRHRPQRTG